MYIYGTKTCFRCLAFLNLTELKAALTLLDLFKVNNAVYESSVEVGRWKQIMCPYSGPQAHLELWLSSLP